LEGINIGLDTSFLSHIVVADLQETLKEMDIAYQFKDIQPCNLALLDSDGIDIIVLPLMDVPISNEKDSWVISGFLRRQPCNYYSYIKEIHSSIFGVRPNGVIGIQDSFLKNQIADLRPDVDVKELDHALALSQLKSKQIDAYITRLVLDGESLHKITIATGDITPKTSTGIYALLSNRVNIKARKMSQLIHDDETGYVSNVERALSNKLEKPCQIYCSQDRAGNYHLNVYKPTKNEKSIRLQISQSTFVGLADRALNIVLNKNEKL